MKRGAKSIKWITRRDEIIAAATKLFADKGYHAATLDEIAGQLDVTKAALYYHINDKEDILRSVCSKAMVPMTRNAAKIGKSSLSPREKVRQMILELVGFATEGKNEIAIVFEQSGTLPPRTYKAIRNQKRRIDQILQDILEEGVKDGSFAINDVKMASFAIIGACNWSYHWYQPGGRLAPEQIADELIHLLENGYLRESPPNHPSE